MACCEELRDEAALKSVAWATERPLRGEGRSDLGRGGVGGGGLGMMRTGGIPPGREVF